jgi:hypothetical protein
MFARLAFPELPYLVKRGFKEVGLTTTTIMG